MRKLNTKRMQRYIYRSKPDRMVVHVDAVSLNPYQIQQLLDEELADFMTAMAIKHQGKKVNVNVFQDEWSRRGPHEAAFVFEARAHDGRMTIVNTPPTPGGSS